MSKMADKPYYATPCRMKPRWASSRLSMGNKKSREYMKQRADLADLARAQTEERPIFADVFVRGAGVRRIQVVCMPSFDDGYSWDIRELNDSWLLYRGVVSPDVQRVRGFDRLNADPQRLQAFFDELCATTLPVRPDLSGMNGLDGTMYQLALFGDLFSALRFEWWSDFPSHWKPLVQIADRMMDYFRECLPMENHS